MKESESAVSKIWIISRHYFQSGRNLL